MKRRIIYLLLLLFTIGCSTHPSKKWDFQSFYKPEENPVLIADSSFTFVDPVKNEPVKWQKADVFNPAAIVKDNKVCLLYRSEDNPAAFLGGRTSRIGLAYSEDGIHFTKYPTPVLYPDSSKFMQYDYPGGCEDPRIIETEDSLFVLAYTSWNYKVARLSIAVSRDLIHWEKKGPVLELGKKNEPDSRSASYGTTYFDGNKWHMFYLGTPNVTPAPDFIPSFPYLNMKAESGSPFGPWIKKREIVPFAPKEGTFYSSTASPGFIVKNNGEFMMFFSAADYTIKRTICIARTRNLDTPWKIDSLPIVPPEEQIENSSLYFEQSNQTWFLFTNHIGIDDDGEYTDAVWVYWSQDLNRWNPDNKAVVLDRENCKWSHRCIGLPSVIKYKNRLAVLYDAPGDNSISHMKRSLGLAFMNLPLNPPR